MYDAAVIGGGISGLVAACKLQRAGYRVAVVERQVRVGGKAVSENLNGFLMEYGPSSVSGASPQAAALSTSLGLDGRRCGLGPNVHKRYLVKDGRLSGISKHPLGFFTSNYLSLSARIRLLAEVFQPIGQPTGQAGDETVAAFSARRFGQEFADRVIDPLVGGLFAARASELSVSAVFPKLLELEKDYGSVVVGALRRRLEGNKMPARLLHSWQGGIAELPSALARELGPAIKTGLAVRRIKRGARGYNLDVGGGDTIAASSVIIATQPHVTADLLGPLDTVAADAAASIQAPPISVIFMGFKRGDVEHPLDGIGSLSPESEGSPLSGILFCSTMFPGRAPEGHVALAAYISGARSPGLAGLPLDDQAGIARDEFQKLLGVRGEPVITRTHHWQRGLPQPRSGHGYVISRLSGLEESCPGLFVTGNFFTSPSIANCVVSAGETAERVDLYLGERPASGKSHATLGHVP